MAIANTTEPPGALPGQRQEQIRGAEIVVPFFSGSRSLALKSSLKSHQMTPFFIQNED